MQRRKTFDLCQNTTHTITLILNDKNRNRPQTCTDQQSAEISLDT